MHWRSPWQAVCRLDLLRRLASGLWLSRPCISRLALKYGTVREGDMALAYYRLYELDPADHILTGYTLVCGSDPMR